MLIKNIEVVDHLRVFKETIYQIVRKVNANLNYSSVGALQLFLIHLLITIPFVAILFKNDDFFPPLVSKIFRVCLFSQLSLNFSVAPMVVYLAVISFHLVLTALIVTHLLFPAPYTLLSRLLALIIKISTYLIVPIVDLGVTGFSEMLDSSFPLTDRLVGAFAGVCMVIPTMAVLLSAKFQLRILRKSVTIWNINNDIHFYGMLYLIFKTLVICIDGVSPFICLVSLGVWYYHRSIESGCIGKTEHTMEVSFYHYIAATDLSVLLSSITASQNLAFALWIFLMACIIFDCLLCYYRSRVDQIYLPPCNSRPEQFYHFYYRFKEECKGDQSHSNSIAKNKYDNIYHLHHIYCPETQCQIVAPFKNLQQLENFIAKIIESKKNMNNMENVLLCELWNLELGKKCNTDALYPRVANLKQEFIVYSIEKMSKDSEVTLNTSEMNKNVVSKIFYDLIYEVSTYYSQFYQELARTHPKIDVIVRIGTQIKSKVARLEVTYNELIKSKTMNFKMIELYIEFLTNFVGENALDKEDIGRLIKAQQHIYFQQISQNYLPTFAFYLETGVIENANAEAQKFLRATRFELKHKNLTDITLPQLSIHMLQQLPNKDSSEGKEERLFSFFKKSEHEYGIGGIIFQERPGTQKKLMIMQIQREVYSDQKNWMLLTKNFEMKMMLKKEVLLKSGNFRSRPYKMKWEEIFQKHVLTNKEKILSNKMIKIATEVKECLVAVKRLRCIAEEFVILQLHIIITGDTIQKRRSSIICLKKGIEQAKSSFEFHADEDENEQKLTFYGTRQGLDTFRHKRRLKTLGSFEKSMQSHLVENLLGDTQKNFSKDIKTYRLYNMDLEDKQAYNQLFEQHATELKELQINEDHSFEFYVFVGVVVLGLGLVALSILLVVDFQNNTTIITSLFTQYINIESLNIDFQRLSSLLRDLTSGFSSNFPQVSIPDEIEVSYNRIQNLKNEPLFTSIEYTVYFQDLTISGTLLELVDVILAHITEVLGDGDMATIEDIHNVCILQLNAMIRIDQDNIYASILTQIASANLVFNLFLYLSLAIVALLYFLMVLFCLKSNSQLENNLSRLLYTSDAQARAQQENAEKMKYAVEMIRKNFDVDTQNLLIPDSDFKRRKNPKQAMQSKEIIYTIIVMALLGLALHLLCLFTFAATFRSDLVSFQTMKDQAISTTTVFHTSTELINYIDHTGDIDYNMLNIIRGNLTYIQYQMSSFSFSPALNSIMAQLYFQNSCALLENTFHLDYFNCHNTMPEFTITNPFEIGLAAYLTRQNFYIFNNITQDYGHTGVLSRPFSDVLTNLTQMIELEGIAVMDAIDSKVNMMNGIIIVIDCLYVLAFVIVYQYFKDQLQKIKDILTFFKEKLKAKTKPKETQEVLEEDEESKTNSLEDSMEEEQQLITNKKKQARREHTRRTTIEARFPKNN